jgi:hypothetical protein
MRNGIAFGALALAFSLPCSRSLAGHKKGQEPSHKVAHEHGVGPTPHHAPTKASYSYGQDSPPGSQPGWNATNKPKCGPAANYQTTPDGYPVIDGAYYNDKGVPFIPGLLLNPDGTPKKGGRFAIDKKTGKVNFNFGSDGYPIIPGVKFDPSTGKGHFTGSEIVISDGQGDNYAVPANFFDKNKLPPGYDVVRFLDANGQPESTGVLKQAAQQGIVSDLKGIAADKKAIKQDLASGNLSDVVRLENHILELKNDVKALKALYRLGAASNKAGKKIANTAEAATDQAEQTAEAIQDAQDQLATANKRAETIDNNAKTNAQRLLGETDKRLDKIINNPSSSKQAVKRAEAEEKHAAKVEAAQEKRADRAEAAAEKHAEKVEQREINAANKKKH